MKEIQKRTHSPIKWLIIILALLWDVSGSLRTLEPKLYKIQISQLPLESASSHHPMTSIQFTNLINANLDLFLQNNNLFLIVNQQKLQTQNTTKQRIIQSPKQKNPPAPKSTLTTARSLQSQENLPFVGNQLNRQMDTILAGSMPQKQIINTQFEGISLYHDIPTAFAHNEIFRFHGIITDDISGDPFPFIHISFIRLGNTPTRFSCDQLLNPGQLQFDVSCKIKMAGTFYFSIFVGTNSKFNPNLKLVKPAVEVASPTSIPPSPAGLKMEIIDNNLIIKWESVAPITKLTFVQEATNHTKSFVLANYHAQYKIPFYEFEKFKTGTTKVNLQHAASKSQTNFERTSGFSLAETFTFEAVEHKFSKMGKGSQKFKNIPWQIPKGGKFEFEGQFTVDVLNRLYSVSPDYSIESSKFIDGSSRVKSGVKVEKEMNLQQEGIYIIEVNYLSGAAIINRPIYVGNGFPLLPDYKDLRQKPIEDGPTGNDELDDACGLQSRMKTYHEKQEYLLCLTNYARVKCGGQGLQLNKQLSNIAQLHTNDMIAKRYTGHVNKQGENFAQRAKKAGFTGLVGENIAYSDSIKSAHLGLERSPAHLLNSANKKWQLAGIGVGSTPEGGALVTIMFTTQLPQNYVAAAESPEISEEECEEFQEQIKEMSIAKNPSIKGENKELTADMVKWQKSHGNRHINLLAYLRVSGHDYAMIEVTRTVANEEDLLQKIANDNMIIQRNPRYTRVSVSVGQVEGQLEILIIYS